MPVAHATVEDSWGQPWHATSAYVHVPFCRHRCGYCNFTLVAGRDHWMDRYLDAIATELDRFESPRSVQTLFLGGGTPTHLSLGHLDRLLELVRRWFVLSDNAEFSVECNPIDLLDADKRDLLKGHGVNRLSLGVQSFSERKLSMLERDHSPADVLSVLADCRPAFESLSIDLIFGVPNETTREWQTDLDIAMGQPIDHLSTYGLTFERGTRYWSRRYRGELVEVNEDDAADMYEAAQEAATSAGMEHYEVSNFAQPGHRSRHNGAYWSGAAFYGVGPGAASFSGTARFLNHRSASTYFSLIEAGKSGAGEVDVLSASDRAREALVFGLRRLSGWRFEDFRSHTGIEIDDLAGETIERYVESGMLERDAESVRLTKRGLLVSDALWPDLLVDDEA